MPEKRSGTPWGSVSTPDIGVIIRFTEYFNKLLDKFKNEVSSRWTPAYFDSPDKLALEVVLALDAWEERGRPGARKTFASTAEFFKGKNPPGHFQLLDFNTTLLGRNENLRLLDEFAGNPTQNVCIMSGRGGIGKSKILHDWSTKRGKRDALAVLTVC